LQNKNSWNLEIKIFGALPLASVIPDIKVPDFSPESLLKGLNLLEYWSQFLYSLMVIAALIFVALTIKGAYGLFKNDNENKKESRKAFLRTSLVRLVTIALLFGALFKLMNLYRLYTYLYPMMIIFAWLLVAAISVWQLSKRKKVGLFLALILHIVVAFVLIFSFIYYNPQYSLGVGYLIGLIVLTNMAILVKPQMDKWVKGGRTFWLVVIFFCAVFFSPVLKHPKVVFAQKLPRFGGVSLVSGTEGKEITDVVVSEKGNTIYFLTSDKNRGLGRILPPSNKPVFSKNGMDEFSSIARLPYEAGNVLAAAVVENDRPEIELYVMEPFKTIGRYKIPSAKLKGARVDKMMPGKKRFYATVTSDTGNFLVACVPVAARHVNLEKFHAGCAQTRIETENPGELAVSDYVNRVLIGKKNPPFGINISVEEWLAKVLRKRRDLKFDHGALTFAYGDDDYRLYFGQQFSNGILQTDSDKFRPLMYYPGPKAISKIYAEGDYLFGASYLEGTVVIYNIKLGKFKNIVVGPKAKDFDFCAEREILYVATEIGIVKIDFSLISWEPLTVL